MADMKKCGHKAGTRPNMLHGWHDTRRLQLCATQGQNQLATAVNVNADEDESAMPGSLARTKLHTNRVRGSPEVEGFTLERTQERHEQTERGGTKGKRARKRLEGLQGGNGPEGMGGASSMKHVD